MTDIRGILVASQIIPSTDGTILEHATHLSQFGKGGWHEVSTTQERDAITNDRCEVGMSVYVTSEKKLYILSALDTSTDPYTKTWTLFSAGGVVVMPTPSATEVNNIVQYIGETTQDYTQGYFYKCVSDGEDPATYSWVRIDVQPAVHPVETANIVYGTNENGEQTEYNLTTFGQIDNVAIHGVNQPISNKTVDLSVVEQKSTMPVASKTLVGQVVQYTGDDTQNYKHNYFYECVAIYTDLLQQIHTGSPQTEYYIDVNEFLQNRNLQTNTQYDMTLSSSYWEPTGDPQGSPAFRNGTVIKNRQAISNTGDRVTLELGEVFSWRRVNVQPETTIIDAVDSTAQGHTTEALSANMGYELNQRIDNIESRGRYLSNWNCQTKKPETDPLVLPYILREGDYYIVSSAVKAEPESCTMTITEGSTFDSQFQQNTYKQKVGTDADRLDYFAYTNVRTIGSAVYGSESLVLVDQAKFEQAYADIDSLTQEQCEQYGETFVKFNKIQFRWFNGGDRLWFGVEGVCDTTSEQDRQFYIDEYASNISTQGWTYDEQVNQLQTWLSERFGLKLVNVNEDTIKQNTYQYQATWFSVLEDASTNVEWTLNGSELPEGDTISSYGVVPVMVQPVLGDSFTIVYRTLKQNFRPEIEIVTIEGEQKKCYNGHASTVVETEEVHVNDTYLFDGNSWILLSNTQKEVSFAALAGNPYDNVELANALDAKVDDVQIKGAGDSDYRSVVTDKIAKIDLVSQGVDYTFDAVPSVTSVKDALDDLMNRQYYVEPSFSTFNTDKSGSYERQPGAISDITFTWTLNKTPVTGDVLQIRTGTNGGTSGDLVYDIIANEPSSNWKSGTYNYSSFTTTNTNKSFHIYYKDNHSVVPSGKSSSTNANTSITFYIKKYYGASALEEPTAAQIKALKNATSSRTLVEEEFNFGDGKYWYYCIPKETDSGAALKFSIGAKGAESPQSGNYFIYEMNDFTNAQGYTVPLRIYKFKKTPAGLPDKITGSSYVKVD